MGVLRPTISVVLIKNTGVFADINPNIIHDSRDSVDITDRVVSYPNIIFKTSDSESSPFQYSIDDEKIKISNDDGMFNATGGNSFFLNASPADSLVTISIGVGTTTLVVKYLIKSITHRIEGLETHTEFELRRPHGDFLEFEYENTIRPNRTTFGQVHYDFFTERAVTGFRELLTNYLLNDSGSITPYTGTGTSFFTFTAVRSVYTRLPLGLCTISVPEGYGANFFVRYNFFFGKTRRDILNRMMAFSSSIFFDTVDASGNSVITINNRQPTTKSGEEMTFHLISSEGESDVLSYSSINELNTDLLISESEYTSDGITLDNLSGGLESARWVHNNFFSSSLSTANRFIDSSTTPAFTGGTLDGTAMLQQDSTLIQVTFFRYEYTRYSNNNRIGGSGNIEVGDNRNDVRIVNNGYSRNFEFDFRGFMVTTPQATDSTVLSANRIRAFNTQMDTHINNHWSNFVIPQYTVSKRMHEFTLPINAQTLNLRPLQAIRMVSQKPSNSLLNFDDRVMIHKLDFNIDDWELIVYGEVVT